MAYAQHRPRTSCPPDEELISLGEDLVKWATEETDEIRCQWARWYTSRGYIRAQWKHMIEKDTFRPYYEEAQVHVGEHYINGDINPSIAHRFIRKYFPDIKEEEDAKTKYDAEISSQHNVVPVSDAIAAQQTAILEQLAGLQVSRIAARTNSKTDNKS